MSSQGREIYLCDFVKEKNPTQNKTNPKPPPLNVGLCLEIYRPIFLKLGMIMTTELCSLVQA